jgi:hypothetical protein
LELIVIIIIFKDWASLHMIDLILRLALLGTVLNLDLFKMRKGSRYLLTFTFELQNLILVAAFAPTLGFDTVSKVCPTSRAPHLAIQDNPVFIGDTSVIHDDCWVSFEVLAWEKELVFIAGRFPAGFTHQLEEGIRIQLRFELPSANSV